MKRHLTCSALLIAAPGLAFAACDPMPGDTTPMATAKLIIENNATDRDIGVHGLFDDDGWTELCVFDPAGALILQVQPGGQLGQLSLGALFFESREPPVEIWDYAALKAAFAEGNYTARAIAHDGTGRAGTARFTTVVPQPTVILSPATVPDTDNADPPTIAMGDITVRWQPVIASLDGRAMTLTGYELIVTNEDYDDPDGFARPIYDVHVGPDITELLVPAAFFEPDTEYEIEVLGIEASGNQTITAGFFATGG